MMSCVYKNSAQYQSLKERAGISEFMLEAISRDFLDKYGRLPYLDELPGSNSEPHLKEFLKVKENGGTKISSILEATGKETLEEAVVDINDQYRDLETTILPIDKEAIVDIVHRPTDDNFDTTSIEQDTEIDSYLVLNNALLKLASLHGIKFNEVSDAELNSERWKGIMPEDRIVNAFIKDGLIYINLDRASIDAPIHEMFHILVGSLRFTNPFLYLNLVSSVEFLPNYSYLATDYQNKTRNDVNEEILVTELSKHLSGRDSSFSNLNENTMYEITYNIKRMLDTILMGQDSVKTISDDRLYNLSLHLIASEVNSAVMTNEFKGTFNVEGSELHRKLNNMKSDLYKEGILEEICE